MSPTDLFFVTEKVCKKLESRNLKNNKLKKFRMLLKKPWIQYDYAKSAKVIFLLKAEHTKIRNAESYLMDIYKTYLFAFR